MVFMLVADLGVFKIKKFYRADPSETRLLPYSVILQSCPIRAQVSAMFSHTTKLTNQRAGCYHVQSYYEADQSETRFLLCSLILPINTYPHDSLYISMHVVYLYVVVYRCTSLYIVIYRYILLYSYVYAMLQCYFNEKPYLVL